MSLTDAVNQYAKEKGCCPCEVTMGQMLEYLKVPTESLYALTLGERTVDAIVDALMDAAVPEEQAFLIMKSLAMSTGTKMVQVFLEGVVYGREHPLTEAK